MKQRFIKLCGSMATLGLLSAWVTIRLAGGVGFADAAGQYGAFLGFMLLSGKVHDWLRVGESKVLQLTWALSFAFWILAMTYVGFVAQGTDLLDDLRIVSSRVLEWVNAR